MIINMLLISKKLLIQLIMVHPLKNWTSLVLKTLKLIHIICGIDKTICFDRKQDFNSSEDLNWSSSRLSVLGPLLFLNNINHLKTCTQFSKYIILQAIQALWIRINFSMFWQSYWTNIFQIHLTGSQQKKCI